ncbi:MAG: Non-canonical purine NTP pyrophosphatase [Candidatus Beckwithbacteria bacterium GW2011_GWB1_47_15]|uniref:dITP/XTP pyrophosphatase n=1 Tax=Candidatus Beckwithbacteria bacterium GW2011_GWB1_47_15 TaxID=1618371 RepID=A0A0G1UWB0_9BACT|nr:MAG: non-canonical purine NTP pyrophosphatase, dITP/XTP pyrophosphatase [Candidatus Beckwithbacteria bacterium GW2011_GWC1_49_16]AQS30846.1 hypothetical protein [uncultured bacterium]KKU36031.1 MAG: Non-canonical purine NTP pyrophosphatase [Candidatus Beckwithbacteria bacterium GW2011_GWA1_46_30]KKU61995.1 MAG: Non-canonical purine NTP pyrophosphatase [Candidatus Beckwithbacteria bacterium GW2011_GWB1_47_15]KKU72451.1 MAG: Non-canonical purine NTP pyrophosphatase [Candidatus Beckwithbacteria
MKLLLATGNQGKLREFKALLPGVSLVVAPSLVVRETGKTFAANAIIKARAYGKKYQTLTVADDSGLTIDALPNQLGIRSARFAKSFGGFTPAKKRLLQLLKLVPQSRRSARFICVAVLYDPKTDRSKTFSGKVEGTIANFTRGRGGFGYDSIFIPAGYSKTFGQLPASVKNKLSHRAQALQKLVKYLKLRP